MIPCPNTIEEIEEYEKAELPIFVTVLGIFRLFILEYLKVSIPIVVTFFKSIVSIFEYAKEDKLSLFTLSGISYVASFKPAG